MDEKSLTVIDQGIADVEPVALDRIEKTVGAIDALKKRIMIKDTHYGRIPGVDRDVLLQPGAEKLAMAFRLIPRFQFEEEKLPSNHLSVITHCTLYGPQGNYLGGCTGSCSTLEKKYRWRNSERTCPKCGKAAIIKGSEKFGGGWVCWKKKDGCGAKFEDGDTTIESQMAGQVENPDIADVHNTVRKLSQKRSFVGAVIRCLSASDIFTQDVEEMPPEALSSTPPTVAKETEAPPRETQKPFKYDRKAIGQFIPDPEEQKSVWAFVVKNCGATKDAQFIYTSKAVTGWDSFLVKESTGEQTNIPFEDDIPFDEENGVPSSTPAQVRTQIEELKTKIAKKGKKDETK